MGNVLDSLITSALHAPALGHFLIKGFRKLGMDLAYTDTYIFMTFFFFFLRLHLL